ncbi:MAG: hypothetical protein ACLTCI_02190 [[Clostridium] nexile]
METEAVRTFEYRRAGNTRCGSGYRRRADIPGLFKRLLILQDKETLSMRALDLIEQNLDLKADNCVMRIEIESKCKLRRGVQYEFSTYFGYQ